MVPMPGTSRMAIFACAASSAAARTRVMSSTLENP